MSKPTHLTFFTLWFTCTRRYIQCLFLSTSIHHKNRFLRVRQCQCYSKLTPSLLCQFVVQGYSIPHSRGVSWYSTFPSLIQISCLHISSSWSSCCCEQLSVTFSKLFLVFGLCSATIERDSPTFTTSLKHATALPKCGDVRWTLSCSRVYSWLCFPACYSHSFVSVGLEEISINFDGTS